jgi:hydroxymethylpyrimidine pyrophosphatase-like HAD family hydrolase
VPAVLKGADYISASNDHNAVEEVIRKIILKN